MKIGGRAWKKLIFLGVGSALMFTMGGVGPAMADNGPHVSTAYTGTGTQTVGTDRCASCHRAHTSKAALNLVEAQPGLCFNCHGAAAPGSSTDVVNGTDGGSAALRAGGFVNAKINAAAPVKVWVPNAVTGAPQADPALTSIPVLDAGEATTSSHQINGTTSGTAWGNGPISAAPDANLGKTITLECGSCHDPHGNGNYRILKPVPSDSTGNVPFQLKAAVVDATGVVTTPAVMSTTTGIKIPDAPGTDKTSRALTHKYTTTNYWLAGDSNVAVDLVNGAPMTGTAKAAVPATGKLADLPTDGYIQNIAAWCTTCHTRYLATSGSHSKDSGDATFMYRHRSDVNYKGGGANCITCHVAHGTNSQATAGGISAGVKLPGGAAAPVNAAGAADSRLLRVDNRGICIMCHNV